MAVPVSHTSTDVLIAEDDPEIRKYLNTALACWGYSMEFADDSDDVLAKLGRGSTRFSLLLLDGAMPPRAGIETLREIRRLDTALPIIMLSGLSERISAGDALRTGANGFIPKPFTPEQLHAAVQNTLGARSLAPSASAEEPREAACGLSPSRWSRKIECLLDQVGSSDVPVLIQGETGSGKEVLARQVHARSRRSGKAFLKLNSAALPSELVESELFGYERGAFTGAFKSNPGKFELAHGGTILLDEIGDMDFKLQAKLLQVLQDHEFTRLGAAEPRKVDVRVIAATHCDLERAILKGRFREDLYYRLNIVSIFVPPLRERQDEIVPLSHFFLKRHQTDRPLDLPPALKQALLEHDWPGNIRELENVMRKYLVIGRADAVVEDLLRARKRSALSRGFDAQIGFASQNTGERRPAAAADDLGTSILRQVDDSRKEAERDAIVGALQATLWNRKQAAAKLNIDYKALLYKMKKLGIGERSAKAGA